MARLHETIHTLRAKPVHMRENIAIVTAGGITLVVAALWFVANAASGTFAIGPSAFPANPEAGKAVAASSEGFSQLLGAAGAALSGSSSPATITIVDTQVHSTLDTGNQNDTNQTVIHF